MCLIGASEPPETHVLEVFVASGRPKAHVLEVLNAFEPPAGRVSEVFGASTLAFAQPVRSHFASHIFGVFACLLFRNLPYTSDFHMLFARVVYRAKFVFSQMFLIQDVKTLRFSTFSGP